VPLSKYHGKGFVVIVVSAKRTRIFRGTAYVEDADSTAATLHHVSGRPDLRRSQILRIAGKGSSKENGYPEFIIGQESKDRIEPDMEHGCDYRISITLASGAGSHE
jgi:hypothetical protein